MTVLEVEDISLCPVHKLEPRYEESFLSEAGASKKQQQKDFKNAQKGGYLHCAYSCPKCEIGCFSSRRDKESARIAWNEMVKREEKLRHEYFNGTSK